MNINLLDSNLINQNWGQYLFQLNENMSDESSPINLFELKSIYSLNNL